tara:strand:+ start:552 stop:755 length:204 start_codon:yes stop_codon:yes gene_type:complete
MNPKDINFKSQDKGYMYTISGTFKFEVYATNEDEAEESVDVTPWISIDILNDKLRLQNLHYKIWKGE